MDYCSISDGGYAAAYTELPDEQVPVMTCGNDASIAQGQLRQAQELLLPYGFGNVPERPEFECLMGACGVRVSRYHDDGDLLSASPDLTEHVDPAPAAQNDILAMASS